MRKTIRKPLMSPHTRVVIGLCFVVVGVITIIVGILEGGGAPTQQTPLGTALLIIGMVIALFPLGFMLFRIAGEAGEQTADALIALGTPVPDPGTIAQQLQAEWGCPPTVEEVAAVHQMLHTERNQAMLTAGMGLGALYLINKNLHHR